MIFAHTLEKVIQGKKWQTRRIIKPDEYFDSSNQSVMKMNNRTMYKIGKSYAVQPNRGKKSVARIQLTGVRKERVDDITENDAQAEGFTSRAEFIDQWHTIHGQDADLSCEVWVFEFELCFVLDEAIKVWNAARNRENEGSDNSKDLSKSIQKVSRSSMYSRRDGSRGMGTLISDRLPLSTTTSSVQKVSVD